MSLESLSEFLVILLRMIAFCDIIGIIGIVFVLLDNSEFKENGESLPLEEKAI